MIHGDCSSRGCYAMTDEQIAEIYALARESFFGGQCFVPDPGVPVPDDAAEHGAAPQLAAHGVLEDAQDRLRPFRGDAAGAEGRRLRPPLRVQHRDQGPLRFDRGLPGHDHAGRRSRRGAHQAAARRSAGRRPGPPRHACRRCAASPTAACIRPSPPPCSSHNVDDDGVVRTPGRDLRRNDPGQHPHPAERRTHAGVARDHARPRPAASPSRWCAPRPPPCSRLRRAAASSATCSRRAAARHRPAASRRRPAAA